MATGALTLARWGLAGSVAFHTFFVGSAWGHGEAQWIADDPRFSYCCGVHDCTPAPDSEVKAVPGGWYLPSTGQTFLEGSPDLHVSRDHRPWWCKPPSWNGYVKCLFVAARGS